MAAQVIAHRGASGYRPEHTLEAFELALALGADGLELDVVMSADGVPVVRHDRELSRTTDIARRPDLRHRRGTGRVEGVPVPGWYAEQLTWHELSSLRATERWPERRPGSAAHDGRHGLARLEDVLDLVADHRSHGRSVRLLVELKDAEHLRGLGLPVEDAVHDALAARGWAGPAADVAVMSFEPEPLRRLAARSSVPLVQLVDRYRRPRLRHVADYAQAVGFSAALLAPGGRGMRRDRVDPRRLDKAHRRGLTAYVWTLRAENRSLPAAYREGGGRHGHGDLAGWAAALEAAGADALITDHPDLVRDAGRVPIAS